MVPTVLLLDEEKLRPRKHQRQTEPRRRKDIIEIKDKTVVVTMKRQRSKNKFNMTYSLLLCGLSNCLLLKNYLSTFFFLPRSLPVLSAVLSQSQSWDEMRQELIARFLILNSGSTRQYHATFLWLAGTVTLFFYLLSHLSFLLLLVTVKRMKIYSRTTRRNYIHPPFLARGGIGYFLPR